MSWRRKWTDEDRLQSMTDLEEREVAIAAIRVSARNRDEARQQARTHVAHVARNRIGELQARRRRPAAEKIGMGTGNEGPVDRFHEAARSQHAACKALAFLHRGEDGLRDLVTTRQGNRLHLVDAMHAHDLFHDAVAHAAAVAKAHITDRAMEAARDAFELHGGIGFTGECDVQMWFKRCMFNRAYLGTTEVHRERSATLAGW